MDPETTAFVPKRDHNVGCGRMSLIMGTDSEDTLIGTAADDTIIGAAGNDYIDGGGAFNIAAYWTSPFGISVRLFANVVDNDGFGARDILNNISGIAGTAFNDLIYGNDLGNYIQGFNGNDTVYGLGGDDLVRVSEGDDFVDGGAGTDRIFFLGKRAEYTVVQIADGFRITDTVPDRYGTDTVLNFELFQFSDTQLTAAELPDPNARGDGLPYPRPDEPAQPPPGFGPMELRHEGFGAGAGAGGWSSDDRFPRHLADVNGDGRVDIVGFGNDGVLVALGDGAGGFGPMALRYGGFGAGANAGGWASDDLFPRHLADVNGDGRADIVGFGNDGVLVALADGAGGFGPMALRYGGFGAGANAGGWSSDDRFPRHLADVNGDGRVDIVGFGNDGVLVALADGAGGFGPMALRYGGFGAGANAGGWSSDDRFPRHLADVNGDGRVDIVGFGNDGVLVALADGAGGFGPMALRYGGFGAGANAGGWSSDDRFPRHLADVNGDGRADIVGFGNDGVLVALGDGAGGFGPMALRYGGFGAGAGAGGWASDDRFPRHLADVNGDGRADIVGFGNDGVLVARSADVWS
jgi:hypothetical protein